MKSIQIKRTYVVVPFALLAFLFVGWSALFLPKFNITLGNDLDAGTEAMVLIGGEGCNCNSSIQKRTVGRGGTVKISFELDCKHFDASKCRAMASGIKGGVLVTGSSKLSLTSGSSASGVYAATLDLK